VTAQRAVSGGRPKDAASVAAEAGALAADLQRMAPGGLPGSPPSHALRTARRKGEVVAAVLPGLRERVEALLRRLERDLPTVLPAVAAHGDFHVDQLVVGDTIAVVDFDGLCVAAPALDLASYAADVVRGRPEDAVAVGEVLEPLLEGYGSRPAALDWFLATTLLARAAHPFQRQVESWPQRVEAMVAAAETIRA
jgi:Ser/Thr protein kinase RdoA (MazF antagonist)